LQYSMRKFDIHIPRELIAQFPSEKRGESRLLILDRKKNILKDEFFYNFQNYLTPEDILVYNDTKVIHARLNAFRVPTGGKLEVLLIRKLTDFDWQALVSPARRVKPGDRLDVGKNLSIEVWEEYGEGLFRISFNKAIEYQDLTEIGEIPLPKYIKRKTIKQIDEDRYQTIYATRPGSVASPTAGLHFSSEILQRIMSRGVKLVPVTLYVDWGTFKPVREKDYRKHRIHKEIYEITSESALAINRGLEQGKRIVCVGTTTVRTLETAAGEDGLVRPGKGETDLYIYPGYRFRITGGLITNFHMPDSTLILLVAAFAGIDEIKEAYKHAVEKRYMFFSYGDGMFIY